MANVYVYSAAAGAGTGADWANAYTTLAAALTAKAAGDDFWVAHDHAETQASAMTLTPPGTAASPNRVICVDRAGSVPPVSADLRTTATTTTTGANGISFAGGFCYFEGITFNCGSGATTSPLQAITGTTGAFIFKNCNLNKLGTSGNAAAIAFGGTGAALAVGRVALIDTVLTFGNAAADKIALRNAEFYMRGGSIAGITGSAGAVAAPSGGSGNAIFEGVDFSAITGRIFDSLPSKRLVLLENCKLASGVVIASTPTEGHADILVIRSDSGDTNYRHGKQNSRGTQTVETTIVRTGGASDGTTPYSWKIITEANCGRAFPYKSLPIAIWNETVGSAITLTLEGIWGGGAVPTNADIWMEAAYLGTSGFPLGNYASCGPADQLAAGANLTSSSETWGGSTTKFKMSTTITPQEKGLITVYVRAALASSTFYIDPKITVS